MTRATAFGNRTISGQRRENSDVDVGEGAAGADNGEDEDMGAMAKVWAHPEDLPMYPVSSRSRSSTTWGG